MVSHKKNKGGNTWHDMEEDASMSRSVEAALAFKIIKRRQVSCAYLLTKKLILCH